MFSFEETGGVNPTGHIKKNETKVGTAQGAKSRNKERNKENKEDYTRASNHIDIGDLNLAFALRITKANSFLKCCRHETWLG